MLKVKSSGKALMMVATTTRQRGTTLDKLVKKLGGIPLSRIMIDPPPGTATEADVLAYLESPEKRICELVDGVLVEKVMGYREARLAIFLASLLDQFVRPRNLGLISGPDGTLRIFSGRVRIPDVAFVSWDRIPNRQAPNEPIPELIPDLAVEVLSISNTKSEMEIKRREYLENGVRLVWEIDPEERIVDVYRPDTEKRVLSATTVLDGEDVLPGFTLQLSEFFAELDRRG